MPKTSCTDASAAVGIGGYVENNIIRTRRISGNPIDAAQVIHSQQVPNPPSNIVVSAGSIPANTYRADNFLACCIESETATENVHSAGFRADQRVIAGAVVSRGPLVGDIWIYRITELQPEQASAWLNRRV